MKKTALILSLVLAIVVWWWLKPTTYQPADAQTDVATLVVSSDGLIKDQIKKSSGQSTKSDAPMQPVMKYAKSLTHVPANLQPEQTHREIDLAFQESTKEILESALKGNTENAINFVGLTRQCLATLAQSEAQLKRNLDSYLQRGFNPERAHYMSNGEFMQFESFEQYENHMWKQFDQCNSTSTLRNNDLRKRIARLAENGHVTARYLFAMWPPTAVAFNSDSIIDWLDYQNLALEFTWQNIEEGEPLGLLAYSQSFATFQVKYFTPSNSHYAEVFLLTAKVCGLTSTWVDEKLSKIGQRWDKQSRQDHFENLHSSADELKEMLCN